MRVINIIAALSGACAMAMLAAAHHVQGDSMTLYTAAGVQLAAALAGLLVANRVGLLNVIGGALILAGATLFAGEIYLTTFVSDLPIHFLAPIGGSLNILGWIVLAFARPT
jgi:uncharacterized membrane protein YgdD (TMEM256/DUF423 family)